MAERNNPFRMKAELNTEKMAVILTVLQKETQTEAEKVIEQREYALANLHKDVHPNTALYGLSKKLQDSQSDVPVGPDKLAAIDETYAQLCAGKWESERQGRAPVVSAEIEALAILTKLSVGEVQANLRGKDAQYKKNLLENPKVVEKAREIRAQREQAEALDLSSMLAA